MTDHLVLHLIIISFIFVVLLFVKQMEDRDIYFIVISLNQTLISKTSFVNNFLIFKLLVPI